MPSTPTIPSPSSGGLAATSSAESSSSTTPRVSSPLNPAGTPTRAPLPLAELDDDLQGFPDAPGRVRGAAMSSPRKRPLSASKPSVTVSSSPASTVTPLPTDQHEGRLSSLFRRARSKSPSRNINDNIWRKKVNELETPPSGLAMSASPSASWWGEPNENAKSWDDSPKRQRKMSPEEKEAWAHTRQRVVIAVKSALGTTADVAHELLQVGADFLELAPVPGLSSAAKTLLHIWDAMECVDLNTLSCLRLTERCAETLIAVRQEIHEAGDTVTQELHPPLLKLQDSFENVRRLLMKEATRPFIKRYLKRDEILRDIAGCDADLRAALDMFNLSVSIRILKQTQESDKRRQEDTQAIIAAMLLHQQQQQGQGQQSTGNALMLTGVTQEITTSPPQSPQHNSSKEPGVPSIPPSQMSAEQLRSVLASFYAAQNNVDFNKDTENLRQLMRLALQTTSDAEMLEILQIKRPEMPEAIKTLQRALERVIERDREPETPIVPNKPAPLLRRFSTRREAPSGTSPQRRSTTDSTSSSSGSIGSTHKGDALDKEFLECGIDALRRMSRGVETNLPSWTITKFEVDRDQKIGIGFFSDVYKGTWRGRTVAIKVLADITPRELFKREVAIWKTLKHPNVLELNGASSTTGDPPWFFVSPYEKNGSLAEFLRRTYGHDRSSGSSLGSGRSPNHSNNSLPPSTSLKAAAERTVTYPIWPGVNSNQFGPQRGRSPLRDTEYRKSRDLHRFMYEIAKGMEYLHSQNVHHGDLKAANVLVDDNLHCVISDFGQSEMKSEAFSLSGVSPPHGTLRWQAPELLRGPLHLTKEMDVYAYAICCVEILSWGNLPWPYVDDVAIRRLVLEENERPPFPTGSKYVTPALQDLVRSCWDKDPAQRPQFSQVVSRMKSIRKSAGDFLDDVGSPRIAEVPELEDEYQPRPSPDIRPSPLTDVLPFPQPESGSDVPFSDRLPHKETSVPTAEIKFPEPLIFTPTASRQSSMLASSSSDRSGGREIARMHPYTGYNSPPPMDDIIAQIKNERRYRLMLTHEYHPSLTLPLWDPSPVDLGAVGYLSRPSGTFITLFNAFYTNKSSLEAVRAIPSIAGYGRVTTGSRISKKNTWVDVIMGLLTSKNKGDGTFPHTVSRRYTYPLKAGHKAAFLCTETTEYRYMISDGGGKLDVPKQWFKVNVDAIMKIYGAQHQIQREELFLVVGTLRAPNYALFVSHNHPEGHAHFSVFASPKTGQPWGMFTTDSEYDEDGPYADAPDESSRQSASKVSSHGTPWDTVLVARLRFKPDSTEPTTL